MKKLISEINTKFISRKISKFKFTNSNHKNFFYIFKNIFSKKKNISSNLDTTIISIEKSYKITENISNGNLNFPEINNFNDQKNELLQNIKITNLTVKKNEDLEITELTKKYEIYKQYEKTSILQKDEEFGEVIKYEDFLEKGLEKFDNSLTKLYDINKNLEKDSKFQELSKLIDDKSKLLYTNYREEYKYQLAPYQERWYKEAIFSNKHNENEMKRLADNMRKTSNPIRNRVEFIQTLESLAKPPIHATFPTKIDTPFENFIDPFQYLFNKDSKETRRFKILEEDYKNKLNYKYKNIYSEILEDYLEKNLLSPNCAFQINEEFIIFKKQEDDFSLYAVNADSVEPINRGIINNNFNASEFYELDKLNSKTFNLEKNNPKNFLKNSYNQTSKNYEIKELFGLNDLINLNKTFTDPIFLELTKRLLDKIELEEATLESFEICPKNQFLFIFFDISNQNLNLENTDYDHKNNFNFESENKITENKSFDILIKDLKNDLLLPIVFHNCDGNISFDKFDGFFYTQKDITNRFCKIFRHQIGITQRKDKIIYYEKNKDFKVKTYNCSSKEYIYIEISTVTSPKINEIWFKPTNDLDKIDFVCFKKLEKNVNYKIKFSNNAFYMVTNKTDSYDKMLKKIIWSKNNIIDGLLDYSSINKHEEHSDKNSQKNTEKSLEKKQQNNLKNNEENNLKIINSENLITSKNFLPSTILERNDITSETEKNLINDIFTDIIQSTANSNTFLKLVYDIIKPEENINIIDFQVFENYVAVLEEVDKKRQIKIINHKTNTNYIHEPDTESGLISLNENSFFKSNYLRYVYSSPIDSHTVVDYSMGTRKSYKIHKNYYNKLNLQNYSFEILNIPDRENEVIIPVHIYYDKNLYNSESPFILYTKGSCSSKSDLEFDTNLITLLDRGFVWAIPQVRGTKFFDFDWYSQGIAENKIRHFTDFIDVGLYLKEKKICEKLILYGDGYSGGITASVALLQNQNEYDCIVTNNAAFDVMDLCMFGSNNISIYEEFGDVKNKVFYEMMKMYSPYHSSFPV